MKKLKQIFLTLAFVLLMVSCFVVLPSKHVSATSATATTIDSYYFLSPTDYTDFQDFLSPYFTLTECTELTEIFLSFNPSIDGKFR